MACALLYSTVACLALLKSSDIPHEVWKETKGTVEDNEGAEEVKQPFIHMDKIWAFLAKKKSLDGCRLCFETLAKVADFVLVLSHSNAGEERVFSLIRLNKTSYRSCLSLDGTLSSIFNNFKNA